MGLDITAYRQLKACEKPAGADEGDYDYDRFFEARPNPAFPGRDDGLVSKWFEFDQTRDGRFGFNAGSYSGYNDWREWLATLAGYPVALIHTEHRPPRQLHSAGAWEASSGPFWELINFADNEGTIGPVVSAKLAKDFAEWQERADAACAAMTQAGEAGAWFHQRYCDWRKAFEMAADGGAVDFH